MSALGQSRPGTACQPPPHCPAGGYFNCMCEKDRTLGNMTGFGLWDVGGAAGSETICGCLQLLGVNWATQTEVSAYELPYEVSNDDRLKHSWGKLSFMGLACNIITYAECIFTCITCYSMSDLKSETTSSH